jgi:hypothetical protein
MGRIFLFGAFKKNNNWEKAGKKLGKSWEKAGNFLIQSCINNQYFTLKYGKKLGKSWEFPDNFLIISL